MTSRRSRATWALALVLVCGRAAAEPSPPTASAREAPEVTQSREEFVKGTDLVKRARWGEALAAFERSSKLRAHAVTTFNIAACERAMGEYTRARTSFSRALSQNDEAHGAELSEPLVANIRAFVAELDGLLATASVTLAGTATIAIDGRPLESSNASASPPVFVAGVRPPGAGEPSPAEKFHVRLNPGAHVVTLSRRGFADAVVNKTFLPGTTTDLVLQLDRLPATLRVASSEQAAIVTVDGNDVGATPVEISRPAGHYRLLVKKPGFVTYQTAVDAHAGEEVNLVAPLSREKIALTQRWWFWTGVAVLVAGAASVTYLVVRKDQAPERPAVDGGGLGWTLPLR